MPDVAKSLKEDEEHAATIAGRAVHPGADSDDEDEEKSGPTGTTDVLIPQPEDVEAMETEEKTDAAPDEPMEEGELVSNDPADGEAAAN
jgi:hypothetical protein